ncbi:MAG: hypothetical protein PT957_00865, partial [Firmicutes bacterium]|nr:hypothetical protein [Bacillota bacterium]
IGAITGSVAWPYYARQTGVTRAMSRMAEEALARIPEEFRAFVEGYEERAEGFTSSRHPGSSAY